MTVTKHKAPKRKLASPNNGAMSSATKKLNKSSPPKYSSITDFMIQFSNGDQSVPDKLHPSHAKKGAAAGACRPALFSQQFRSNSPGAMAATMQGIGIGQQFQSINSAQAMTQWFGQALQDDGIRSLLSGIFEGPRQQIEQNTSRIESLEQEVSRLNMELDELKQYGRRNAVVISNPDWPESNDENTDEMVEHFI